MIKCEISVFGVLRVELVVKTFRELTVTELYEILKVRACVFVVEQACAYQDVDGLDRDALHVFLGDESGIKAYLRLFSKDERTAWIGRVLTMDRGRGFGAEILKQGIRLARDRLKKERVYLEAQTYAVGFYEKEGFRVVSEEFLEDGIPHVGMLLEVSEWGET